MPNPNSTDQSPLATGRALLRDQFGFNQWATTRILEHAAKLNAAALHAPDQTSHGSAFQLLLHTLDTEWGWRIICQEQRSTDLLWEVESIPDLATLAQRWSSEHTDTQAYLDSLSDDELFAPFDIGTLFDQPPRIVQRAQILSHILYHSNSHRSELAVYLTHFGHSPGDLDFLDYAKTTRT